MNKTQVQVKKLLGTQNAKTIKNDRMTYILYMSPADANDHDVNICPFASEGCITACLNTSGMGRFDNVQASRRAKTNLMLEDRKAFYQMLAKEIMSKTAKSDGLAFRLNGTSDVDHIKGLMVYANLDIRSLNAQFYDYTPNPHRMEKYKDYPNYTLTFSRKEDNHELSMEMLANGHIVAVVFSSEILPAQYEGYRVLDGDTRDDLMIDLRKWMRMGAGPDGRKGIILGLRAKGRAKRDESGFVVKI